MVHLTRHTLVEVQVVHGQTMVKDLVVQVVVVMEDIMGVMDKEEITTQEEAAEALALLVVLV